MKTITFLLMISLMTFEHSQAQRIAAGYDFSLLICEDSTVVAFGLNDFGQLGDSTLTNRLSPVGVKGLSSVKAVCTGFSQSLALKSDGTVWSWGGGIMGDSSVGNRLTPVQVKNLNNVIAMSSSFHSLALKSDGTVWSWGNNQDGQLGDGTKLMRLTPVKVLNLSSVNAISAAPSLYGNFSLALKSDGTLWQWGNGDSLPVQVNGLSGVIKIAAGDGHFLALKSDGTVWAWGDNMYGQLGDGTQAYSNIPLQVSGISNIISIAAGHYQSYAIRSDNTVWAWGENYGGQLGCGTYGDIFPIPFQIPDLSCINEIESGEYHHVLAFKGDGSFWAWGENAVGQLGDGTTIQRLKAGKSNIACLQQESTTCTSLVDEIIEKGFNVSPNPSNGKFIISFKGNIIDATLRIFNMLGREIIRKSFSGNEIIIEKGNLESGVYFLEVSTDERQWVQKIIVE